MPNTKDLAITLLNNSRISGVKIKNGSTDLSEVAHGLYIESMEGDRYADLRLCTEKPFWGHTHPLEIHAEYGSLQAPNFASSWRPIERRELESWCSENDIEIQKVNGESAENLGLPKSNGPKTLLWKINPMLAQNPILTSDSDQRLIAIETSNPKLIFVNFSTGFKDDIKSSPFEFAALKFCQTILHAPDGKFQQDTQFIAHFLRDNKLETRIHQRGYYLEIRISNVSQKDFRQLGLLLDGKQIEDSKTLLCIPCSCTKDELLDTLMRVKSVVER